MAFIIKDRVKEATISTGTGTVSLGGSIATFDAFSSYLTNGDTTYYAIVHTSSGVDEWEVGLGTWNTGNTLTRTTVLSGSNGTSAQDFSAGTKDIFMTYPAAHAALAGDDVDFANVTVTGTVDGRDVATDGSKLDTIESNADVTDAVNVAAVGALMRSGGTMTGNLLLNANPSAALGAATKEYVDTIASAGIHYHDPVRAEHPSNLSATYNNGSSGVGATLTNSGSNAALVLDGVSMALNDRVLVANQTNKTQNGVYTVTTVGDGSTAWVLTRSTDTDSAAPSDPDAFGKGDAFFIKEGAVNAGHLDVLTTAGTIVFGTSNIVFAEVAETTVYSAGTGITLTGSTFAIGQGVGTTDNVTFNQVTAAIIGNVTGNVDGDVTGNAGTATALETARTVQLSGDVTGSATFDGSANINILASVQDDSHAHVISNVDGLQGVLDAKVPTSRTITSGNGLTGGGSLTANRTLNVGAGTGVTVNADTVSIGQDVGTSSDVTFAKVTADLFIAEGGTATSTYDSPADVSLVTSRADYIYVEDDAGNYLRRMLGQNTAGVIEVGQGGTSLITGINLRPGNAGQAQVNGVQIITDAGNGLTKSGDELAHADTSSQASVNSSNGTVIQDITLDTFGHITGIASTNLDGRYYTESEADSRFVNVTDTPGSGDWWNGGYAKVGADGVMEIGKYIDWHDSDTATSDYSARLTNTGAHLYASGWLYASSNQRVFADNYHPNADKWTTARTLSLSGDASGNVTWDGSANATLSVTVNNDSHTHDTRYMRTDTQGLTSNINTIASKSAVVRWNNITTGRPASGQSNEYGPLLQMAYDGTYVSQLAHDFSEDNLYFRNLSTSTDTATTWKRLFHDAYHPNADKWTTARTLSLSGDASGNVTWDGSANATLSVTVADNSHSHNNYTPIDHMRSTGNSYYTSTTTSALLSEVLGDGAFNSYFSTHKTGWSYAGNGNLTDAGRLTELAGTSWAWWTDNSGDGTQGNVTALVIAPNTGGSANKMFVYNNQGSTHAPGWREVWTSASDGDGSGLDADLLDGVQGSDYVNTTGTQTISGHKTFSGTSLKIDRAANVWKYIRFQSSGSVKWDVATKENDVSGALQFRPSGANENTAYITTGGYFASDNQGTLWGSSNDGAGSGLDADLLDGVQGSSYLRSDTNDTFSGLLTVNTTNDYQLALTSSNSWTGIYFNDSAGNNDPIWHNGTNGTFSIGGGGSNVAGKKLHVHGGLSVGSGATTTSTPTNGIHSEGDITTGGAFNIVDSNTRLAEGDGNAVRVQTNSGYLDIGAQNSSWAHLQTDRAGIYMNKKLHVSGDIQIYNQSTKLSGNNIYLDGIMYHNGDTDTYMQFHAADQWRVVTGGAERLEVNNNTTTLATHLQINSHAINMDMNNIADNAIEIREVRDSSWPFQFVTNDVGNDNYSGFWVGSNGYPDMRLRRDDGTVRALISSWETSYVSNGFSISGGTLDMNNNDIVGVDQIVHEGDTDTYIQFGTDEFNVYTGGSREITVNSSGVRLGDTGNGYFQPVSGNYGSIQIDGGAHSAYEGYSIGGRVVFMHDNGGVAGLYNDVNNEWMLRADLNGACQLYHDGSSKLQTSSTGIEMSGRIDMNNNAIVGVYQLTHQGDTDTYIQFHAADQWRVVTGGAERLEVNNSQITSTEPIHAPSFHGDGSSLTGIASGANDDIFWENGQNVTSNYTVTNGKNAMSAGPITINSGVTVTVGAGETWTVV